MPVFEVRTDKSSPLNTAFTNRYYVNTIDLGDALDFGVGLANFEQKIFGSTVNFVNVHARQMGTALFANQAMNISGLVSATTPMKSEMCAEITWGVYGSYSHYKKYRLQHNASSISGIEWGSGVQILLGTMVTDLLSYAGILCTADGTDLGDPVYNPEYVFQQVSKRWHNRATS